VKDGKDARSLAVRGPQTANYDVGYAKPPERSRFKKGYSGNPRGRPRGAKNKLPRLHEERLKTIDYGGGARWFAKPHLAFSFDLRFYAINPSAPTLTLPAGPRTRLMVFGAGVSIK
jgi:hypothetical protein